MLPLRGLPGHYNLEFPQTEPLHVVVRLLRPYSFAVTFKEDGSIGFADTNAEPTSIAFFSTGGEPTTGVLTYELHPDDEPYQFEVVKGQPILVPVTESGNLIFEMVIGNAKSDNGRTAKITLIPPVGAVNPRRN